MDYEESPRRGDILIAPGFNPGRIEKISLEPRRGEIFYRIKKSGTQINYDDYDQRQS